jgi:hypothetical protein
MVFGALVALCQSAAMRRTPGVRLRWVVASAIGYYLASIAGDYASGYAWQYFVPDDLDLAPPGFLFLPRIISSLAAGVVFGLITCGVIERILFRVQPEAVETA